MQPPSNCGPDPAWPSSSSTQARQASAGVLPTSGARRARGLRESLPPQLIRHPLVFSQATPRSRYCGTQASAASRAGQRPGRRMPAHEQGSAAVPGPARLGGAGRAPQAHDGGVWAREVAAAGSWHRRWGWQAGRGPRCRSWLQAELVPRRFFEASTDASSSFSLIVYSSTCQGMSWQHLHQPCVAGKV